MIWHKTRDAPRRAPKCARFAGLLHSKSKGNKNKIISRKVFPFPIEIKSKFFVVCFQVNKKRTSIGKFYNPDFIKIQQQYYLEVLSNVANPHQKNAAPRRSNYQLDYWSAYSQNFQHSQYECASVGCRYICINVWVDATGYFVKDNFLKKKKIINLDMRIPFPAVKSWALPCNVKIVHFKI
jgi:hypothetical protein